MHPALRGLDFGPAQKQLALMRWICIPSVKFEGIGDGAKFMVPGPLKRFMWRYFFRIQLRETPRDSQIQISWQWQSHIAPSFKVTSVGNGKIPMRFLAS